MSALIVFGGIAFSRLGVSQLPDVDFPVISVSLRLPGAAPEIMETDVVDVVEGALATVQGVKSISSSSRIGSASVSLEFSLGRNINQAQQDVESKLRGIARDLPNDLDPIEISKTNPEDSPIIMLSISSESLPRPKLMAYVRDVLKAKFATVEGVGDIDLMGFAEPNLRVWISEEALRQYALTVDDVISTIAREHADMPAGVVDNRKKEFNVRLLGEAVSVEEFKNLIITSRGGQPNYRPIRLGQVARIEEGLEDIRRIGRSMGRPAVGLGIIKQRGSNEVQVARAVKARLAELQPSLPKGIQAIVNVDNTQFTERAVEDMNFTLVLSAIFTALVCWLFLGNWSSTLNVLLAIPTSVIGTFLVLYFTGFTLNTFTLLALSLVIGIVVDDAIMMLENIMRHRERGEERVHAALVGAREITFAATATSLAIIAIFLPVAFMRGVMGRFFFQFGVTISVAVLLSLLEALTLTPMRCSQFLEVQPRRTRIGHAIEAALAAARALYGRYLAKALARRGWVLAAALLFFGLSLLTFFALPKEFLPVEDQSRFVIRLQMPVGTALSQSAERFIAAEQFLLRRDEVERVYLNVGGGRGANTGFLYVTLKPRGRRGADPGLGRERSQAEFMELCREELKKLPGVKAIPQDLAQRAFSASRGFPIEFNLLGPDWETLAKSKDAMQSAMEESGLMTDVDSDYKTGMPELRVLPDRNQATARGVSMLAIGNCLNAMIGGVVAGTYTRAGHRYDIRIKMEEDGRGPAERINRLQVRNNRGELIPLSGVVRLEEQKTMQSITRKDRERAITLFANIAPGASQQAALEAIAQAAKNLLPEEYRVVFSGSARTFQESFGDLFLAMFLGVLVAYMILASQFNSYLDPLTILLALPFSVSGAFLGLWLTHQSLNIYSLIGLVLLLGLVKKNAILLVDFTNQVRLRGESNVHAALLEACPIRLRPILMTSLAIIAGALPVALAIGPGAESRVPMAVAVIGGVLVSTLLTLFVVPCVYSLLAKFESRHAHQAIVDETEASLQAGIEIHPKPRRLKKTGQR
jgi:HAE1 family hydrophobic/amphiphilic exporter-1